MLKYIKAKTVGVTYRETDKRTDGLTKRVILSHNNRLKQTKRNERKKSTTQKVPHLHVDASVGSAYVCFIPYLSIRTFTITAIETTTIATTVVIMAIAVGVAFGRAIDVDVVLLFGGWGSD